MNLECNRPQKKKLSYRKMNNEYLEILFLFDFTYLCFSES